jgi:hypothetical protein
MAIELQVINANHKVHSSGVRGQATQLRISRWSDGNRVNLNTCINNLNNHTLFFGHSASHV